MATFKATPGKYAEYIKDIGGFGYQTKQAVQYRINNKLPLAGVIKRELILDRWVLTVDIRKVLNERKNILKISA